MWQTGSPIALAADEQIMGYLDDDCGPNGLQVPGSEQIQTVVPGDGANADLFAREPDPARRAVRPLAAPLYAD